MASAVTLTLSYVYGLPEGSRAYQAGSGQD